MSTASAMKARPLAAPSSRPVVAAPKLSVVPSPVPRRGFATTIVLCAFIFFAALLLSFYLNTRMVQGAYDIKDIKMELTSVQMREESLESSNALTRSSEQLRSKAAEIGMIPATDIREVNVDEGTVITPSS